MTCTKRRGHLPFGTFRKRKYDIALCMLGVLLPLVIIETLWLSAATSIVISSSSDYVDGNQIWTGRRILEADNATIITTPPMNCTPRAVHNFPNDFMTSEQRRHGGVLFHIFVSLYLFVAIAVACDDFFVPALEKICEVLAIQPDVAGATFMAAGSSAPEFFAAVIGIFFAKSDIGLSTIVGSAVFNLLLVNAVCGLFAGMVIYLTWWPVIRDCSYYFFSVIILIIVMYDEVVHWYESLIMVLLYIVYITMMYFNRPVGNYLMNNITCCHDNTQKQDVGYSDPDDGTQSLLDDQISEHHDSLPLAKSGTYGSIEGNETLSNIDTSPERRRKFTHSTSIRSALSTTVSVSSIGDPEYRSPLSRPQGCWRTGLWALMLPTTLAMTVTTPDFRRGGCWTRLYTLTFLVSCLWIAGLSYLLVWMVTIAGDTLGIPDTVMGLTLLAVGTSVPDAIASLIVAKDGYGDMAVSNSVGSNVFDILLCLGLPWLIKTGMVEPGSKVEITSIGLTYSTITLLGTIVFLVGALWVNKWRLDKRLGIACLVAYVAVVTFACLNELNVFGFVNPPMCPW